MLFDRVNPALELGFMEDGERTETEVDAGRGSEPMGRMKTKLGQHATTTQGVNTDEHSQMSL